MKHHQLLAEELASGAGEEILPEHFVMADSRNIVDSVRLRSGWGHYWSCKQDSNSSSEIVGGIGTGDTVAGSIVVEAAVPAGESEAPEEGACCGKRMGLVCLWMSYGDLSGAAKAAFGKSVVLRSALPMSPVRIESEVSHNGAKPIPGPVRHAWFGVLALYFLEAQP